MIKSPKILGIRVLADWHIDHGKQAREAFWQGCWTKASDVVAEVYGASYARAVDFHKMDCEARCGQIADIYTVNRVDFPFLQAVEVSDAGHGGEGAEIIIDADNLVAAL